MQDKPIRLRVKEDGESECHSVRTERIEVETSLPSDKRADFHLVSTKTKITHIEEGFDFLGQNARKYNGKLIIKPSHRNVQTFLGKVRELLNVNKQTAAGNLIVQLNPIIRGWANYHRHVGSYRTFNKVDDAIFDSLWKWAIRRHPNKHSRWVKDKYFKHLGSNKWVFTGETTGRESKNVRLVKAGSVPIKRHTKVKGEANPYAPEWETYFERRLAVHMEANLKGYKKLLHLWLEQQGLCPVCHQKITKITGWHSHHIIWRVKGGKDGNSNRVLLHPNCHRPSS